MPIIVHMFTVITIFKTKMSTVFIFSTTLVIILGKGKNMESQGKVRGKNSGNLVRTLAKDQFYY